MNYSHFPWLLEHLHPLDLLLLRLRSQHYGALGAGHTVFYMLAANQWSFHAVKWILAGAVMVESLSLKLQSVNYVQFVWYAYFCINLLLRVVCVQLFLHTQLHKWQVLDLHDIIC